MTYGNKMYVWGGQRDTNSERYFNDMHCFDFRTHYWHEVKQQGSIPEARCAPPSCSQCLGFC